MSIAVSSVNKIARTLGSNLPGTTGLEGANAKQGGILPIDHGLQYI
jgi:hypothetical protein